jgi:hypothetical protein
MMDSTFGTNNSGSDLFTVLAEVEGTGVPPGSVAQANIAIYCDVPGTDLLHSRAYLLVTNER